MRSPSQRVFCAVFSQFEAKNDPKRGFGAQASKKTFQWPKGGGFFPPPIKKEERTTKDGLLLRLRPADFRLVSVGCRSQKGEQGSGIDRWNGEYFRENRGSASVSC
jgi:hypothetical protein